MGIRGQSESLTERCLRRAVDDAPVGKAIVSGRAEDCGTFLDVNRRLAMLFDRTPAELLGRSLVDFMPPDERRRYDELLSRLIATHEPVVAEFQLTAGARHHQ